MSVKRVLGKAARGMATGVNLAIPLIAEDQRAENRLTLQEHIDSALAKRDRVLSGYQAERDSKRAEQADRFHEDQKEMQSQQFGLDRARIEKNLEQMDLAIQSNLIDLDTKQQLQQYRNELSVASAPDEIENLTKKISALSGSGARYQMGTQRYVDEAGYEVDRVFTFDPNTGEFNFDPDRKNGIVTGLIQAEPDTKQTQEDPPGIVKRMLNYAPGEGSTSSRRGPKTKDEWIDYLFRGNPGYGRHNLDVTWVRKFLYKGELPPTHAGMYRSRIRDAISSGDLTNDEVAKLRPLIN